MASQEKVGARIRQCRERAGLTQGELGRRWGGRSHAAISDIEHGKARVSADELPDLAQILDVRMNQLLGDAPAARTFHRRSPSEDEGDTHAMKTAEEEFKRLVRSMAESRHR